jgi:predicted GTPase
MIKHTNAPITTGNNALFFILNIWIILCVHERLTRINERFPITNVTNAAVLTIVADCHNRMNILYIVNTISKTNNHCNILKNNVLFPKSDSLGLRGKRDMIFASSFSHSNITEHAGSIINSIKTTCTG